MRGDEIGGARMRGDEIGPKDEGSEAVGGGGD